MVMKVSKQILRPSMPQSDRLGEIDATQANSFGPS